MKVPRYQLAEVLGERSLKAPDMRSFSQEIAAYLLDEGRSDELDSVIRDILQYRLDHGVVEVWASSAHEFSPAIRTEIEREVRKLYPDAKQIVISEIFDPEIIGGVRLEFANEQLDLSIRAKLNRFKQLTSVRKEN